MVANGSKPQPLQTSNDNPQSKTIEEIYQKRSQHHHILLRPDTYIGSNVKSTETLWIYEGDKMVNRAVTYVPGLYKIFDEILVNAADNKQRDPSMNLVEVEIDVENNLISVFNNGQGVPVARHEVEKVFVPEMIFGQLLTSSNYDDATKKTVGGRNGFGAKLTNIFSTEFVVETLDAEKKKKYKQVFSDNMNNVFPPIITDCDNAESWTRISFKPDLAKFQMDHLESDVVALMKKRVVDIAGCLGETVKVVLNKKEIPVKSFSDYVDLYLESRFGDGKDSIPRFVERVNDRWEICVCVWEAHFEQVSFVNAIATMKGGTHVNHVTDQLIRHVNDILYATNPEIDVKPQLIKNNFWVFVNALIDNPSFNSQTKLTLTTNPNNFGSSCELGIDFLEMVCDAGVVDNLMSWMNHKQKRDAKRVESDKKHRITSIKKLEDANEAGGTRSKECTLILTEGDSAKALAMAGVSSVGRDCYGVFPLRGKMLNVREANENQITSNEEIQSIMKILKLERGKNYDSIESLRYGHLMIMTDQDHEGSHIKGLLINLFHSLWPSLLKIPSFLVEFITPIVKATGKSGQVLSFYSVPEYDAWRKSLNWNTGGWSIKYYKGLGTSTSVEGKEYFRDLEKHKKDFLWAGNDDGDAIELAFSKNKIEARKKWLQEYKPGTYLNQKEKNIKYSDFVNKELIQYSVADLKNSIPSIVDGLKPGQRKILFCCFKKYLIKDETVAQFSGYVSAQSAYHYGEQSLANTIVSMAQDYVGSNNINLLQPNGQFGTRLQGGKDHASARYMYTCLSPITLFLFHINDDCLLQFLHEDGKWVEPNWYVPIIPMVLVNGTEGIGTGWSTFIPNYNPRDIVANVRHFLNEKPMEAMVPWYKGFKGNIEKIKEGGGTSYSVTGIIEELNRTTVRITELPVRKSTEDYKEFLDSLISKSCRSRDLSIKDFKESNDDKNVNFEVYMSERSLAMAKTDGLIEKFKLSTTISTNNMHLFDQNGVLVKYSTPEKIIEDFCVLRLEYYEKRKEKMLKRLEDDLLKLENQVRFIKDIIEGKIVVMNRKRSDLMAELSQREFTPFRVANATSENDYSYLLSMPIGTLTMEKVQALCAQRTKYSYDIDEYKKNTPKSLWLKDLDALEQSLNLQSNVYDRPEKTRGEVTPDIPKGPKRAVRNGRKSPGKKGNNNNTTGKAPEAIETQDINGKDEASNPDNPPPAEAKEDRELEQEQETPKQNKSTESNAKDLNTLIIEISDTEMEDCEDEKQEASADPIEISDSEVVNEDVDDDKQLEARTGSAQNSKERQITKHAMITRKREKENNLNDNVVISTINVSPEKKLRRTSSLPFGKNKRLLSPTKDGLKNVNSSA